MAELGLGTMNFGRTGWGCDAAEASRIVARFLDAGGTHVDTADVYGDGASEEILGRALAGRRDAVALCTKAGWPTGGPADRGTGLSHLARALDASLARLRTDHVDVFYAHVWDRATPALETAAALSSLVRAGKARQVGVCNHTGWQLAALAAAVRGAGGALAFLQTMHALSAREVEWDSLVVARREGLRVVAWGALGSGLLTGKYRSGAAAGARLDVDAKTPRVLRARVWTPRSLALVERLADEARGLGWTPAALATAWSLGHDGLDVVLAGPRTAAQLGEQLGARAHVLPAEVRARLDEASAPAVPFPHDEADAVAAVLRG